MAEEASGDRNEALIVEGDTHAQAIFETPQGERLLRAITDRMRPVRLVDSGSLRLVAGVDLGRRAGRFYGGEGLLDLVRMRGALRNQPGVAGLKQHFLAFEV